VITWHEFERLVKPVEAIAKGIVRETERLNARVDDVDDAEPELAVVDHRKDTREIQAQVLEHVEAYAAIWGTSVETLTSAIDLPDVELAPLFLGTVRSQREKAKNGGKLDPELDATWQSARDALRSRMTLRAGLVTLPRRELGEAIKAASKARNVVLARGGEALGWIPRARINAELRTLPSDATWEVDPTARKWCVRWKNGRGGLRFPLEPLPPEYQMAPSVWVHLDPTETTTETTDPVEPSHDCEQDQEPSQHCEKTAQRAPTEDHDMAKQTKPETKPEVKPEVKPEPAEGGIMAQLDALKLNASIFGINGRTEATVVLYTRTKPSKAIAKGKGPSLEAAMASALAQASGKGDTGEPATGEDMF